MSNLEEKLHELALPAIGEAFGGGYLAALMPAPEGRQFAIIVAPKAEGEKNDLQWKSDYSRTKGTDSANNGFDNSEAMNNAEHPAAQFCRGLTIGGHTDWYLPASAEQAAIWANLGPNHTPVDAFKSGQPEAYDASWYWTSTEYGSGYAWVQDFDDGLLDDGGKGIGLRVRAVRKVLI
jgi:hypothetical protein